MADPLSVAGLAAGVVSLGIQVCGGITKYLDALDCREQDILSAKQQNECLRKALQVVEASLARLQRDHSAAAAAVQDCLDSSKQELSALNDFVTQLAGSGQPSTGRRGRIKAEGRKLLYPFHRSKLEQLESRLRNANATLQVALQALGLYLPKHVFLSLRMRLPL
jgi:DNA anti-recombination protein RmuC